MFSCIESGLSAMGVVGIFVSIVSIIVSYYIGKHYSPGNVQIVKEALDQVRLDLASSIIQEIGSANGGALDVNQPVFKLYLENPSRSVTLKRVFHDLDFACAIVQDDAISPAVRKSAAKSINDYLSRVHVLQFVMTCGDEFPALQLFAKEIKENWKFKNH